MAQDKYSTTHGGVDKNISNEIEEDVMSSTGANFNNFFTDNALSPPDSAGGPILSSSHFKNYCSKGNEPIPITTEGPISENSAHFRLTFSSN